MNKAILLGRSRLAVASAMLAVGYRRRQAGSAIADDAPQAMAVASADSAIDRSEVEKIVRDYLLEQSRNCCSRCSSALEAKQKEEQRVANLEVDQERQGRDLQRRL